MQFNLKRHFDDKIRAREAHDFSRAVLVRDEERLKPLRSRNRVASSLVETTHSQSGAPQKK
jgi:hypothetical protein